MEAQVGESAGAPVPKPLRRFAEAKPGGCRPLHPRANGVRSEAVAEATEARGQETRDTTMLDRGKRNEAQADGALVPCRGVYATVPLPDPPR